MKASRKALRSAVGMLVVASASLGGCASVGPPPWQHDLLAKKEMQLNPNPNLMAFEEHIYFSKEGASGGRTFDGGGCGCN